MTTQTLTLSDFLFARIAEDAEFGMQADTPCGGLDYWKRPDCSDRILADVWAKREMVEALEIGVAMSSTKRTSLWFLRIMASPYRDHPDYREEWLP